MMQQITLTRWSMKRTYYLEFLSGPQEQNWNICLQIYPQLRKSSWKLNNNNRRQTLWWSTWQKVSTKAYLPVKSCRGTSPLQHTVQGPKSQSGSFEKITKVATFWAANALRQLKVEVIFSFLIGKQSFVDWPPVHLQQSQSAKFKIIH